MLYLPEIAHSLIPGNSSSCCDFRAHYNDKEWRAGRCCSAYLLPEFFGPLPITREALRHEALIAISRKPGITVDETCQLIRDNPAHRGDMLPEVECRQIFRDVTLAICKIKDCSQDFSARWTRKA